jgi:hypothetical protein
MVGMIDGIELGESEILAVGLEVTTSEGANVIRAGTRNAVGAKDGMALGASDTVPVLLPLPLSDSLARCTPLVFESGFRVQTDDIHCLVGCRDGATAGVSALFCCNLRARSFLARSFLTVAIKGGMHKHG